MDALLRDWRSPPRSRGDLERLIEHHFEAVERLIAELDEIDGDADLEPSLGSVGCTVTAAVEDQLHWAAGGDQDDREDACEGEGDHDEREPEIGDVEPECHPEDQRRLR